MDFGTTLCSIHNGGHKFLCYRLRRPVLAHSPAESVEYIAVGLNAVPSALSSPTRECSLGRVITKPCPLTSTPRAPPSNMRARTRFFINKHVLVDFLKGNMRAHR